MCNVGEVFIFEYGLYMSFLEHTSILILSNFILMALMKTVYKYCHDRVI